MKQVTFDKNAASFILQLLDITEDGLRCYCCSKIVTADTLGGIAKIENETAVFHDNLGCLIMFMSAVQREEQQKGVL